MKARAVASWMLLLVSASSLSYAQGSPPSPDIERSKELFAEGRRFVDAGNCQDGVRKLEESLRYAESIGVRLTIAECAKGPLEAWRQLKMAELLASKNGDDRVAFARARADALEPQLAMIRIDPAGSERDLPGFEVRIDHTRVDPFLWRGGKIAVEPGRHVVEGLVLGKRRWRGDVEAIAGTETPVSMAADSETSSPAPSAEPSTPRDENKQLLVGLVVGGVGAVSIVVGAVAGVVTLSKKSDLAKSCEVGGGSYGPNCGGGTIPSDQRTQLSSDYSTTKTAATVSTVGLVAGALLLAGGAVLVLTAPRARTTVAVNAVAGFGGVTVGRAW
jgi:hypothetical protein